MSNMSYDILMIDPPWKKSKGGLRKSRPRQTRDLDYDTMEIEDIFALLDKEIFPKANETNTVFMWCIDKYITVIDDYMFERGYKKHCIFIWNKLNGVAPAFTVRYSHEYLIWYYKPKMIKIAQNMRGKLLTVFEERSREHSRKPNYAYKMIDELYPDSKKIDVFSRENRIGWDVWGNETDKFSTIDCDSCFDNAPRDSKEIIHYTPNGNILTADECLCTIDCVECGEEIDLHEEDTMGEHCLTCYWLKREVIDADDYEGNKEWDEIRLKERRDR